MFVVCLSQNCKDEMLWCDEKMCIEYLPLEGMHEEWKYDTTLKYFFKIVFALVRENMLNNIVWILVF